MGSDEKQQEPAAAQTTSTAGEIVPPGHQPDGTPDPTPPAPAATAAPRRRPRGKKKIDDPGERMRDRVHRARPQRK